jgi:hypothetical protein
MIREIRRVRILQWEIVDRLEIKGDFGTRIGHLVRTIWHELLSESCLKDRVSDVRSRHPLNLPRCQMTRFKGTSIFPVYLNWEALPIPIGWPHWQISSIECFYRHRSPIERPDCQSWLFELPYRQRYRLNGHIVSHHQLNVPSDLNGLSSPTIIYRYCWLFQWHGRWDLQSRERINLLFLSVSETVHWWAQWVFSLCSWPFQISCWLYRSFQLRFHVFLC